MNAECTEGDEKVTGDKSEALPGTALLRGEQRNYVDEYDNTAHQIHSEALLTQHVHVIFHIV